MPCDPSNVAVDIPIGPSGPSISGFGVPFAIPLPNINPFPTGFPEDLLEQLNKLQLLIPPGALKPQLSLNFGKDVFDSIMKLLDQFMPFLMLYKFFLPILNIIICIIEVLCAIPNPFKLIRAISRLFSVCIPEFLNLFPIFALIIMIISLLLLLLALIEYIIAQIAKFIVAILRNIAALNNAFQESNTNTVLAIAKKLGSLLCIFQNLFVLLALFSIIIQIIRDVLSISFSIPPCDDGDNGSINGGADSDLGCCTPDVCPAIVKNQYTKSTGQFNYIKQVGIETSLVLPAPFGAFNFDVRNESWQLYDTAQNIQQAFSNIVNAYDVTPDRNSYPPPFFKPTFFPTDSSITNQTASNQAPYLLDLRVFYNPSQWGRSGLSRYIKFKDCVVLAAPSFNLTKFDNTSTSISTGVISLGGGKGYEDDGTTILYGFADDGTTLINNQATLENFIHKPKLNTTANPVILFDDGYNFQNIQYIFKPNIAPLIGKNLVTLGCAPDFALNKNFINSVYAGDVAIKTTLLGDLINGRNGNVFPDPNDCQQCLAAALDALRSNLSVQGVAQFQATTTLCLNKLKDNTNDALGKLVGLGFDPCKSSFSVTPIRQFTSKPMKIKVDIKERNGLPIAAGLSGPVAENIAARIKAHATFGDVSKFNYDGYQSFISFLTANGPGDGTLMISFDNNTFCTNVNVPPSHTLQTIDYHFVYTPIGGTPPQSPTATGDQSDGKPRRDEGDLSRDSSGGGN